VCRNLQENPTTCDIQIVFLTADNNPDNLAELAYNLVFAGEAEEAQALTQWLHKILTSRP
jgi:CheY-like chemotaxis protein